MLRRRGLLSGRTRRIMESSMRQGWREYPDESIQGYSRECIQVPDDGVHLASRIVAQSRKKPENQSDYHRTKCRNRPQCIRKNVI